MIALARQFGRRLARTGGEIYTRVVSGGRYTSARSLPAAVARTVDAAVGYAGTEYDLRDLMLDGRVYYPTAQGGALKYVLRALGRDCDETKYPITAYFNPVPQIVGFYGANALGGSFGKELTVTEPDGEGDPAPALAECLRKLWRWSNLDTAKAAMCETAANHGAVGIRVALKDAAAPRAYLDFDDPRYITNIEQDERGNVINVWLKYDRVYTDSEGNETDRIEVEEWIGKDGFSLKLDGEESLLPAQRTNPLSLCPYVLLKHDAAGRHAYHGSERVIHAISWGASQLDESVWQHIWPYLFATAPAAKPRKFVTGRYTFVYAQTQEGQPVPTMETMVPDLDYAGAIEALRNNVEWLLGRQPQLIPYALRLLSGISGETLAQIKVPAESECLRARMLYEDALVRALQIALSVGIFNRLDGFDLGTGTGSVEAVEAAYGDGEGPEAFRFKERPALPVTPYGELAQAQADLVKEQITGSKLTALAGVASNNELLRMAGKTDAEIARINRERAAQDTLATDGTDPTGNNPADAAAA